MDLLPVKPLIEDEAIFKNSYKNRLQAIYQKLRS